MYHAVQIQVVGVLPVSQHLGAHVGAEGPVPYPENIPPLQLRAGLDLPTEDGSGQGDALNDFLIAGTPADVPPDGLFNLGPGGAGLVVQKGLARQHHAGDAESALDRPHLAEGIDKRLPLRWPEALHGGDGLACAPPGAQDAALDRLAVRQDGTGTAGPLAAPVLDGGQL